MLKRLATTAIDAFAIMLAALACLFCVWRIDRQPEAAVLAVVLCVSLGRSQIDRDLHGRIEALFVLPAVALVCAGVGRLLHAVPVAGALVYVLGMALSIWMRRFGLRARRVGGLIALPFVTLLTIPVRPSPNGFSISLGHESMHFPALMLPILTGWLALFWVALAHLVLKRLAWHRNRQAGRQAGSPRLVAVAQAAPANRENRATPVSADIAGNADIMATPASAPLTAAAPPARSARRLLPSTRMALQMAVALGLAFVVGDLLFREHWAWIVMTAMIVNLGNRGRLDVVYKGCQRLAGAAAGTLIAFVTGYAISMLLPATAHLGANGTAALFALFLGVWLRPFGYAWWALCITIALALLEGLAPLASLSLLGMRLVAIAVGAVIGAASAWWIYPIDSADVVRRRLADALARLGEAFDPGHPGRAAGQDADASGAFREALAMTLAVAPVFRAARRLMRWMRRAPGHGLASRGSAIIDYLHALSLDADRIDALHACERTACDLLALGATPPAVRRAVGAARKTLRDREANLKALHALADQLERARHESCPAGDNAWSKAGAAR